MTEKDDQEPIDVERAKAMYPLEEWDILEGVARDKGWEWTLRYADMCLEQARLVGDLPPLKVM